MTENPSGTNRRTVWLIITVVLVLLGVLGMIGGLASDESTSDRVSSVLFAGVLPWLAAVVVYLRFVRRG